MKKCFRGALALWLALSAVLTFLPMTVSAASVKTVSGSEYIQGHDVGFHDSSGDGAIETAGTLGVCLRGEEWVSYKITGLDAGDYVFSLTTSNTNQAMVTISVNGEERIVKKKVAPTGSYLTLVESEIDVLHCDGDAFVLKVANASSTAFYVAGLKLESKAQKEKKDNFYKQARPYKMSYLPCILEAENFDSGAQGEAYSAHDEKNAGGAYRSSVGIDIYEAEKGYTVSLGPDEWMNYTFRVDKAGSYELLARCADNTEGSCLRFYINGYEVIRNLQYPKLPLQMDEVSAGVLQFKKGVYTLTVKCMEGDISLDWLRFKRTQSSGIDVSDVSALRPWSESQTADAAVVALEPERHETEKELYVSANAAQNGDGSRNAPFKTIAEAQKAVRSMNQNMQGDIVVHLSGSFFLEEPLAFSEADSGTNGNLVIWQGDEGTTLHGGKKVSGWQAVEGTPLYKTTLVGQKSFRQLYVGENRATRARSKWLYFPLETYAKPNRTETLYSETDGFILNGEDFPNDFSKPEQMEFVWLPSWRNVRVPVESMQRDENGNLITVFCQPAFDLAYETSSPISVSHPFYIENAPELLDEAGEWYFNTETEELFYYPAKGEDMQSIDCYIPETEGLLTVRGTDAEHKVRNIMFEGISFRYGAWERTTEKGFATIQAEEMLDPDNGSTADTSSGYGTSLVPSQIRVEYGDGIHFVNNEFAHLGSVALAYDMTTSNSMASGNIFDDVSASAVTVSNWHFTKDAPLEQFCRKVTIANNLMRRVSVEYMTPAITAYYVNNLRIAHNDILDTPYTGISMGWGWGRGVENCAYNKIENNRIENVLYKVMDGGHIYTLDPQKGSVISGNHIIKSGESKGGIYHDNASAYITTHDNVFEDCYKWLKITWHNIHDNTAYNNYSETPNTVKYPDYNNIADAIGKTDGEWPEAAKQIIANAGLDAEHKGLLERYAAKGELRNVELERMPYDNAAGTMIPAGEHIHGKEGEAYHEVLGYEDGPNRKEEPDVYESYNGTGHTYIMATAQGEWTKYRFTADEEGDYDVFLNLSVTGDSVRAGLEIDGETIEANALTKTCDDYSVFADQHVATVHLAAGEHVIKVEHAVGNFGFWSVRIAKVGALPKARDDGFRDEILSAVLH